MPPSPGSRLHGYELLRPLGSGGMGEVWLARDLHLDRQVALKLLPAELTRDLSRVARFHQEARAASALNHPNVCTIHALSETADGQHFIAMEYVEGETLRKRLTHTRVTIGEALDAAIQIASALAAAHGAGIVHRDLKPENVMLRPDGFVKVLDFGLAKLAPVHPLGSDAEATRVTLTTTPGALVGTVAYMSPEQARGQTVDVRTDVWSLGCVIYEMVTGRGPFAAATASDVLVAILDHDPVSIAQLEPNVPAELERIVIKALQKDREERYQTVKDLLVDLKALKRQLDSSSSHESAAGAARSASARRRPRAAARLPAPDRTRRLAVWWAVALAVASVAAVVWVRVSKGPVARTPMEIVPFTSFPGRELHPSFSPDGKQIAFAWEGEHRDNLDIYVKLVGEGRALRLTVDPRPEFSPAWSPDGGRIAFYRADGSAGEVVLVPPLGGPERVVLRPSELWRPAVDARPGEPVSAGGEQRVLSWFDGGQSLAVVGRRAPGAPAAAFALSLETGELRQMTTPPARTWGDLSVAVSPDSRRLAVSRSEVPYWVVPSLYWAPLTNGEAGELRRADLRSGDVQAFAWESDGEHLLVSTPVGLRRVAVPAGTSEPLQMSGYAFSQPAVSPDGQRLAFVQASSDLDIWRAGGPAAEGAGTASQSLISSTRLDTNPAYAPDGKRIAFSSNRSGSIQTWVSDADGANAIQLTNFSKGTGTPRWSPDGRHLAFDSVEAGTGDIYVVPSDGGPPRRIGLDGSHEQRPSWSRNGEWIYFESDRTGTFQLWKKRLAAGLAAQVTTEGGADAFESPDGTNVYYAKEFQQGLWRKPVAGGPETAVSHRGRPNLWAMYDRGLCVLEDHADGTTRIDCLEFESGRWSTAATLPRTTRINRSGPSLSVSRDGQSVLYVTREREESDIMLVDDFRP